MPISKKLDEKIRQRFSELLAESDQLIQDMAKAVDEDIRRDRASRVAYLGVRHVLPAQFTSLQTRLLSLIELLATGNQHLMKLSETVRELTNSSGDAKKLKGYLHGLKSDYESGMLESLSQMIEANI